MLPLGNCGIRVVEGEIPRVLRQYGLGVIFCPMFAAIAKILKAPR